MTTYILLLATHIICVVVWLGTTTTLALLAAYGSLRHDRELLDRLPALTRWFGPRAIGPSSVGTLLSGILLAVRGDVGFGDLWLVLAVCAFVAAALVSIGVRLPALVAGRVFDHRCSASGLVRWPSRGPRAVMSAAAAPL